MVVDRRVVRTRIALYDAMVALVRRKDYDRITVEDILQEADVGRATFYAHFTSKDDLLERSLDRLRDLLVATENRETGHSPARILFEHVREFRDIPIALSGSTGAGIIREAVDKVLADYLRRTLPPVTDGLPRELVVLHVVSALNTTLSWWLDCAPELSPEEAHMLFRQLVLDGLPADVCMPFA